MNSTLDQFDMNGTVDSNFSWIGKHSVKSGRISNHPEKIAALILSILGILANCSSVVAIARIRGSISANHRLIISLCIADMLVCASVALEVTQKEISLTVGHAQSGPHSCLSLVVRCVRMTSHAASLMNLVGLALDHYFAIVRPLSHLTMMSCRRANIMIVIFWTISLALGLSHIYLPIGQYSHCEDGIFLNYCEYVVFCTTWDSEYLIFSLTILSFLLIAVLYTRICIQIRRYQNFHGRHSGREKQNRRGLITTICIVGTFALCWLPYCLFEISITIRTTLDSDRMLYYMNLLKKYDFHLYNLLLVNSLSDPVIYAVRMREVQNSYCHVLRMCKCHKQGIMHGLKVSVEPNSTAQASTTMATKMETSTFL